MQKARMFCCLLAMIWVSGCSHKPLHWEKFNFNDPGWTVYTGQTVWKPAKSVPELTGDLTVAVNTNGLSFVQFTKTFPMATARTDGARWQIEFATGDRLYSGHFPLPKHFGLLRLATVVTNGPVNKGWVKTGTLDDWELRNDSVGELLHGYLNKP